MSGAPAPLNEELLIRLHRGEIETDERVLADGTADEERRSLLRSRRVTDAQLLDAARVSRSRWALEALTARVSDGSFDWPSLRTELVAHGTRPRTHEPALDRMSLEGLWLIAQAAMAATADEAAVAAVSAFLAHRSLGGGDFPDDQREALAAMLLRTGQHRLARRYGRGIATATWMRDVLDTELEHPRFGGSFEGVLSTVSQAYRRAGLEPITLGGGEGSPWERMRSEASSMSSGPLVSVVVVASSSGAGLVTAARSIIAQSYRTWEMLLIDAGPLHDDGARFGSVLALDDRIRWVGRSDQDGGAVDLDQLVRDHARGEFVLIHSDRSWSHPRRIELQVADLVEHPAEVSSVVRGAWVSAELSFVQVPIADSFGDDQSVMTRHDSSISEQRAPARLVGTEVPLLWTRRSDEATRVPAPRTPVSLDLLVVADFFHPSGGSSFSVRVADEIAAVVTSGLRIGVLQRDAIGGSRGPHRAERLEQLIAEGRVTWIEEGRPLVVDLVVVRHASAAQAYASIRLPVTAERVVVIDDPSSGDARAMTFAHADVTETVSSWFGRPPEWAQVVPQAATPPQAREAGAARRTVEGGDRQPAPVLSIVMPVYNVAPFLETAIVSVLYQEFHDFELIIVDDASTDGSRQIIDMYAAMDPRIQVIGLARNSLGGAGIPSNRGIAAARGKYLGFVDSDDILVRGAFARMVETAEQTDAELVIGGFSTFNEDLRVVESAYDLQRVVDVPRGVIVSAVTHPDLLRMSPVPWRKLYRMSFVDEFRIEYPEGDYFYEDNPLHWTALVFAEHVVLMDEVVSLHRMGREGQTMSSAEHRKGAYAHHFTTALRAILATHGKRREVLLDAFVEQLASARWAVRQQTHPGAKAMLARRFATLFDRAAAAGALVPAPLRAQLERYRASYPYCDLTVVIPAHNCAGQLRRTLEPILTVAGANVDVLVVDDGSTDRTLSLLREYESRHSNVHVFEQRLLGFGRACNSVIPLITGRFTLFLEAGDVVDPRALAAALREAEQQNSDLLFVRCKAKESSADGADEAIIWKRLRESRTNAERQDLVAGLDAHPSNRLIRTELLQDSNIFFGGAGVFDDVPFHWHSVLAAERIGSVPEVLVTRKKFTLAREATRRVGATDDDLQQMLSFTQHRIAELPGFPVLRSRWLSFSRNASVPVPVRASKKGQSEHDGRSAVSG